MIRIVKTIGRLISVLAEVGVIKGKQAVWILEPLIGKAEVEPQERSDKE